MITYNDLSDNQKKFYNTKTPSGYDANRILYHGGIGAGKVTALFVKLFDLLKTEAGIKIAVIQPHDYYLEEFNLPKWEKVYNESELPTKKTSDRCRHVEYINGSILEWRSYQEPNMIRGFEANVIAIIDAQVLADADDKRAKAIYSSLIMRLRAPGNFPRKIFITQENTGNGAPKWTFDLFNKGSFKIDNEYEKVSGNSIYYTVTVPTTDNIHLPSMFLDNMKEAIKDDKLEEAYFGGKF